MKIKTFLIGLFALATVGLNANSDSTISADGSGDKYGKIRSRIIEKIESVKEKFNFQKSEEAHVCFTLKEDGTIEVQQVISKNEELAKFIKTNLDKESLELDSGNFETGTSYWITLDYNVL